MHFLNEQKHLVLQQQQQQQKKQQESEFLKSMALRSSLGSGPSPDAFLGMDQYNGLNLENQLRTRSTASELDSVRQLEMETHKLIALEEEMRFRENLHFQEQLLLRKQQQTENSALASAYHQLHQRNFMSDFHHDLEDLAMRQEILASQNQTPMNFQNAKPTNIPSGLGMFNRQVFSQDGVRRSSPGTHPDVAIGNSMSYQMHLRNLKSTGITNSFNGINCPDVPMNMSPNMPTENLRVGSQNLVNHMGAPLQTMPMHKFPSEHERILAKELILKEERARHEEAMKLEHALIHQQKIREQGNHFPLNHFETPRQHELARIEEQVRQEELEHIRKRDALILQIHKREEAVRAQGQTNFQMFVPLKDPQLSIKDSHSQDDEDDTRMGHTKRSAEMTCSTSGMTKSKCRNEVPGNLLAERVDGIEALSKRKLPKSVETSSKVMKKNMDSHSTQKISIGYSKSVVSSLKPSGKAQFASVSEMKEHKKKEGGSGTKHTSDNLKPDITDSHDSKLRFFNNGIEVNVSGTPLSSKSSSVTKRKSSSNTSGFGQNILSNKEESFPDSVKSTKSTFPSQTKPKKLNESHQHINKRRCTVSFLELISYVKHRVPEVDSRLLAVTKKLTNKNVDIINVSLVSEIINELKIILKSTEKPNQSTGDYAFSTQNYRRRIKDCIEEIEGFKSGLMASLPPMKNEIVKYEIQDNSTLNASKKNGSSRGLMISTVRKSQLNDFESKNSKTKKENTKEIEGSKRKGKKKGFLTKDGCDSKDHLSSLMSPACYKKRHSESSKEALKPQINKFPSAPYGQKNKELKDKQPSLEKPIPMKKKKKSIREQDKTLCAANVLLDFMKKR